jgi:SLOG cluster2
METEKNISGISENLAESIAEQKELELKSRPKGVLDGVRVAVSVSDNEDLEHLGLSTQHLKDIMIELARYIMANGGTLLYGGHLKNEGFTKLFAELSYQYKFLNDKSFRFINYFPFPNSNSLTLEIKADFVKQQVEPVIIDTPSHLGDIDKNRKYDAFNNMKDRYIFSECFSDMRRIMADKSYARLLLGGKQSNFLGYLPGIIEEAYYSLKANKPIYIIGGFGGAAKSLSRVILGEVPKEFTNEFQYNNSFIQKFKKEFDGKASVPIDYQNLLEFFRQCHLDKLSGMNGLSVDENLVLFESQNIHEIVFLIMKGLKKVNEKPSL